MLRRLRISNFAILPEVTVELREGLNVLTGETGAGKSILVDAVGLLGGKRAAAEDVRAGAEAAVVEGVVSLERNAPLRGALSAADLKVEGDEVVLRRTVGADGRSRAFVNDWQQSVSALAELSVHWLDVSGQHGQQELLKEDRHVSFLDEYGGYEAARAEYRALFEEVRRCDRELEELRRAAGEAARQRDFLSFQYRELSQADLRAGEARELEAAQRRLANAEKLARGAEALEAAFEAEEGIGTLAGRAISQLRALTATDPSLEALLIRLEQVAAEAAELGREFAKYGREIEFDPARIEEVEARLSRLQAVARKYGSVEAAIGERERAGELLKLFEDSSGREAELSGRRDRAAQQLLRAAEALTRERAGAAEKFSAAVVRELRLLGMPSADFAAELAPVPPDAGTAQAGGRILGPAGAEGVRFELAPNPGEGFRPLAKIASGGELSRILLAVKGIALAGRAAPPVAYLFDEVDSGIGGETAERVGIRLRELARGRQVLCVTHLAQIACYADTHIKVEKSVSGRRTAAVARVLDRRGRREELGRMIGGIEITPKTLGHASELLRRGDRSRKRAGAALR